MHFGIVVAVFMSAFMNDVWGARVGFCEKHCRRLIEGQKNIVCNDTSTDVHSYALRDKVANTCQVSHSRCMRLCTRMKRR